MVKEGTLYCSGNCCIDRLIVEAQTPCLSTFITDRTWLFFHLVGRNAKGWLQRAPEGWPQNLDYTFMSEVARYMVVVNDCAECNIKAIAEYNAHGMSIEC